MIPTADLLSIGDRIIRGCSPPALHRRTQALIHIISREGIVPEKHFVKNLHENKMKIKRCGPVSDLSLPVTKRSTLLLHIALLDDVGTQGIVAAVRRSAVSINIMKVRRT